MKNTTQSPKVSPKCRECGSTVPNDQLLAERQFCSYRCVQRWEDRMEYLEYRGIHR